MKISRTEDKDTVLCNYLNTIYFGRGAYGIQAAAQNYFGKDAKDLTMPESAMLAGIIPAPTSWDPAVNPKQAESRFHRVLAIMEEDHYISHQDRAGAQMPQTIKYMPQNVYQGPNSLYAGDDYLTHQLNNVDQATFQVGSTMKAYTLLGAIQDGVSLNTVFNGNSPRTFSSVGKSVANAGNVSYGYINLYSAFANSVNTVFMDLGEHVTSRKVAQVAHTAGITGKIDDTTTFDTLGVDALTVYDVTQGYATLANGGQRPKLHLVAQVKDAKDQELYTAAIQSDQVFNAEQVALLQKAMTTTVQRGTASYARSLGRPIAGKTGTANDQTAISFIGFTPSLLTTFAIWNQGQDGSALKVPDRYQNDFYTVQLFTQYMKSALGNSPIERFPDAEDHGKVGGPEGNWGSGSWKSSNSYRPNRGYSYGYSYAPQQRYQRQNSEQGQSGSGSGSGAGTGGGTENDSNSGTVEGGDKGSTQGNSEGEPSQQ